VLSTLFQVPAEHSVQLVCPDSDVYLRRKS
jgi:hypothetical protein